METIIRQEEKTIRLFTYLKELSSLKSPLVRDIKQYEDYIFLNEIPNEPECVSPLFVDIKDTWVEIQKPTKPVFLKPNEDLIAWLDPSFKYEDMETEPKLIEKIPNPEFKEEETDEENGPSPYLLIQDFTEIKFAFDNYFNNEWIPWKAEYSRYEEIQEIYTKLYSLYQKHKKLGEQFELLLGIGLLNWRTPEGQIVHRHVLTVPCQFQFDSSNGIIRVVPSAGDSKAEIEQDMLELESRLDNQSLSPIKEKLDELQGNIWTKPLLNSLFKSFAFSLSANGTYQEEEYSNKKEANKEPNITYSPALILRKRTEKGFQQACSTIIENAENGKAETPQGILRIFEELDDYHDSNSGLSEHTNLLPNGENTIFFPLDSNEEQRKIITNLETRNGVLVQGPPGTGKSHTIANLTSHLLASGKKVLITSETPRALKVLKDKIPKELQALCVSLLGGDSKSFKDLESVVQVISNKRDTWDKDSTFMQISELTDKLRKDQEKQAQFKHQLRSLREKETYVHHFMNGLYTGTAQKIATKLAQERPNYQWLTDIIEMDAAPPLTNDEATELLELLHELNEEIQHELQLSVPAADLLFSNSEFQSKVLLEQELLSKKSNYQNLNDEITTQLSTISPERRSELTALLNELANTYRTLSIKSETWLLSSLEDLIQGKFTPWEEFNNQINTNIETIQALANKHNLSEVSGVGQVTLPQLHSDAKLLRTHFESGKGLGMPLLRAKVVKDAWYIVQDVRIDGRKCDTLEPLILLEEAVYIDLSLKKIEQMISDQLKIELGSTHSRALRVAAIKDILEPFSGLFSAKQLISKIKQDFNDVPVIHQTNLNENTVAGLTLQLESISLTEELAKINHDLLKIIKNIHQSIETQEAHPIVTELLRSIENREVENYRKASNRVKELDVYSQKGTRSEVLLQKVKTMLPKLYSNLLSNFDYERWTERFKRFEKAFAWAKVNTWFTEFSLTSEGNLKKDLTDLEKSIKETIITLGAQKAWFSTLDSMTEGQRQHLLAWTTSMRKVGKGTGKNAYIHLQDAQKHMVECREAIPAWIMPLYRVFETFEVKPNLFDVVIIDEASQSGPDAIILQYIAKKLIVVGDDKQISPEYIGIKREDIQYLRNQYLFDFKLADMLDIENSFFDLANVLFGGRITLREHFRCMPEIIQFSNRISYSHTPLIPLRQYPPNRLTPVQTRHVSTGYREGAGSKVFNRPEAEAVVAEIQSCIENSMYEDKTIGVISLQAEGQAQLIEKLLIERIGPEEMEKRQIICGDAYAFQGDERDIMFLSMVAAPGQTAMRALATEKDKRRFNVAVSRARDQLWLFHTPTLNDIRNKECLRYQLISYCENPEKEILESNRALCESEFEIAVFDQITSRGYRVIPQFQVAGYRIDLVVEGSKGRIAVECDGDQWHGPDRFDYDRNRQRILERSGWKFWRVRGSDYYYDPEKALTSLWETLAYYGIEPEGFETITNDAIAPDRQISLETSKMIEQESSPNLEPKIKEYKNENDVVQAFLEVAVGAEEINQDDSTIISTETLKMPSTMTLALTDKNKKAAIHSSKNDLNQYLINKGYEVVDKRDKGGALWLIGGQELTPFISELKQEKIHFTFSYNGSKSTAKRPGWFTTYRD